MPDEHIRLGVVHRKVAGTNVDDGDVHPHGPGAIRHVDDVALAHLQMRCIALAHHDDIAPRVAPIEVLLVVDHGVELSL